MVADFAFAFLSVMLWLEKKDFHNEEPVVLGGLVGIGTFFYNFGNNTFHWLFALKYWIIASEVPKLFEENHIKPNERSYKVIKWVGLLINWTACFISAYYRGALTARSGNNEVPS